MAKETQNTEKLLKEALLKSATGYEYDEKEIILDKNGKASGKVRITKKQVPPSMRAIERVAMMIRNGEW